MGIRGCNKKVTNEMHTRYHVCIIFQADAAHGGHNIKRIMDAWTLNPFYPLVTLSRTPNTPTLSVSQSVYLSEPENEDLRYLKFILDLC